MDIIRLALDKQNAPFNTTGQESCVIQLYGRNNINLACLLLSGMSLMGKNLSFHGAFMSAILRETILANCTECSCLKNPEEFMWFYTPLPNTQPDVNIWEV